MIAVIGPQAPAATLHTLAQQAAVLRTIARQSVSSLGKFQGDYSGDMVDDGARVHVVWQSQAGLFHTSQARGASQWEQETKLPIPPGSVLAGRPRLLLSGRQLFLVCGLYLERWTLDVSAGEAGWRSLGPLLSASDPTFAYGEVAAGPRGIVLAGGSRGQHLEVLLGAPNAERFVRKTVMVLPGDGSAAAAAPYLMLDGDAIHILWEVRRPQRASTGDAMTSGNRLLHFYSPDFGETWRWEEVDVSTGGPSLRPFVIVKGADQWWILYQAPAGLSVRRSQVPFGAWQTRVNIAGGAPPAVSAVALSGRVPLALWVDNRYHEQESWGRIPFHQVIMWDRSPDWKNNDAFAARLDQVERGANTIRRLTVPLSYTEGMLRAVSAGDFLYVLRKGRAKVGYTLEQFGAQPELFVHVIRMEELK